MTLDGEGVARGEEARGRARGEGQARGREELGGGVVGYVGPEVGVGAAAVRDWVVELLGVSVRAGKQPRAPGKMTGSTLSVETSGIFGGK